jgi:hypothetical protein
MNDIPESDIRRLRRLVAETGADSTYTDAMLEEYIAQAEGVVYWAAAEICQEKAAAAASLFDFSADGGTYNRGDISSKWQKLSEHYRTLGGKRNGGNILLQKWPVEPQRINVLDYRTDLDA